MTIKYILQQLPEQIRLEGNFEHRIIRINGKKITAAKSLKLERHSLDGFNWGYGGSGPAQLALAILLEFLPKEGALEYYHSFKFHFVATLPRTDFDQMVNLRQIMHDILQKHPSQLKTGKLF